MGHQAAEALGAIGFEGIVPLLENTLALDPAVEVKETCELALRRIREKKNAGNEDGQCHVETSPFLSVDPALPASLSSSVEQLRYFLMYLFYNDCLIACYLNCFLIKFTVFS